MKFIKGQRVRFSGKRARELVKHNLLLSENEIVTCTKDSDSVYAYTTYNNGEGSSWLWDVLPIKKPLVIVRR